MNVRLLFVVIPAWGKRESIENIKMDPRLNHSGMTGFEILREPK